MFSVNKKRVRRVRKTSRQPIKKSISLHASILKGKEKKAIYFPTFSVLKKVVAVLMIGLFFLPLCRLSAESTYVFFTEDCFTIKKIEIENNLLFSKEEVRNLAKINKGENIWDLDLLKIKDRLEENANIAEVVVSRKIPDIIQIKIYERVPSFVVHDGNSDFFADKDGYILSWDNQRIKGVLPIIEGVSIGKAKRVDLLTFLYSVCEDYSSAESRRDKFNISTISYVNEFEINLTVAEKKIIKITQEDDFLRKFLRLEKVLEDLEKKNKVFELIDLRFDDVIVR